MVIFTWKEFTAKASGRSLISVKCEMCGAEYRYELVRTGVGKGRAPYYLGQTSAAKRAKAAAEKALAKSLEKDAELVPCPKCFWINQYLVKKYRKSRYSSMTSEIIFILIISCITAPLVRFFSICAYNANSNEPNIYMYGTLVGGFALSLIIFLLQFFLRLRIDPNSTYPRQPTLPPGTPPALVQQINSQSQKPELAPVPSGADPNSHTNSLIFRAGHFSLPPICCVCLGPSTTTYKFLNDTSDIEAPLCHSCDAALKRRCRKTFLTASAASFIAAGVLALSVPGVDNPGRWSIFFMAGFFTSLFAGGLIAILTTRPLTINAVDSSRNVYKITARNPNYSAILAEQIRASEGRDKAM